MSTLLYTDSHFCSPIYVDSRTQCSPCPMETDSTDFTLLAEQVTEADYEKQSSDFDNNNISPMQLETCDSSENLSTTNRINADKAVTQQESSNIPNAGLSFHRFVEDRQVMLRSKMKSTSILLISHDVIKSKKSMNDP
jgi:hypothetical protein